MNPGTSTVGAVPDTDVGAYVNAPRKTGIDGQAIVGQIHRRTDIRPGGRARERICGPKQMAWMTWYAFVETRVRDVESVCIVRTEGQTADVTAGQRFGGVGISP